MQIDLDDSTKLAVCTGLIMWPDGGKYPALRQGLLDAMDEDGPIHLETIAWTVISTALETAADDPWLTRAEVDTLDLAADRIDAARSAA